MGRLDATKLELALLQAQIELESAELWLSQAEQTLKNQTAEAELALQTAEARLVQAKLTLDKLA